MHADPAKRPIRKTRYCLSSGNQYFEIDIYPFWQDKAILEIELSSEQMSVKIPEFLQVLREVTGEKAYQNAALASM